MSWLYSQALAEAFWEESSLDGEPFAQLNVMPTPHKFSRNDKTMDACSLSQFGLTCEVLTASRGEELLTSFLAAFHAKTSAPKVVEMDSMASAPDSGAKWIESSVKYCRDSLSWRTHRCLWDEALLSLSVTLPRWGMTRNGLAYQHPTAERPISATESGLLPTPMATDWKGGTTSIRKDTGKQRLDQFRDWIKCVHGLMYPIPEHSEAMMGWPIGWTDLRPLGTDKFREWLQQHGRF